MQIQKSFKEVSEYGTLYLVPTPIGNMEDISFRVLKLLESVSLIVAEDTRVTGALLKHFEIKNRLISFHEHNAQARIPELLEVLAQGQDLAQVSDAGLPSISDPGHDLVKAALEQGYKVVPIPGPSAGITALIASGLVPQPHIFYGFLPRKAGQQQAFLESKRHYPETQIFYESPYRLAATLEKILAVYGNRQLVLVRELTKIYEEFRRGSIQEVFDSLLTDPIKGECLLIVEGYQEETQPAQSLEAVLELLKERVSQGQRLKTASQELAKETGLKAKELYQAYHQEEKDE
ncbi:16S rRNA (cytidine(1402)-2'-O)-methyltransferase [Streptococcus danieliae]|uniref:Ribosomal RNA small subunit methyltransferase I n=1 Tax=Streptococcus danieliae TaxID=747656 RepID=A0A7Z0LCB7_9STRE|nr:16S rRNA (cytidine(1402)-2'-O)-methyltransferase [Streptococcus danieliae]MBF0716851.1 16S rRNA (cytidine(1402)-2'-O)-methyltransferase [Streptococcus danieliae]NYS48781.1 16S rRNA (cytidine(1402)-2'-O)-methyltransferase [Streptococcus danieliae]